MSASDRLPLPALLSAALVAFTIEFDNEAEHRMPHRTTWHRKDADRPFGPWLVSAVMWWNCMRFVGPDGITVGELARLAGTPTNLNGMQRWGYVSADPDNAPIRGQGRPGLMLRATAAGRASQQVWQSLAGVVEQRWQERFGAAQVAGLTSALAAMASHLDAGLPDCLPILRSGLFSRPDRLRPAPAAAAAGDVAAAQSRPAPPSPQPSADDAGQLPLAVLLSRVLLAFALEFESESEESLAICANVLRVLTEDGVLVRDLPGLSGVSKESIAMALGFLAKRRLVTVGPAPAGRGKIARLSPAGREAQSASGRLVRVLEDRWRVRFGPDAVDGLRALLEPLAGDLTAQGSPLFRGLVPYPENWRAATRQRPVLPQFPMVLHRGGYPDGS